MKRPTAFFELYEEKKLLGGLMLSQSSTSLNGKRAEGRAILEIGPQALPSIQKL
jgi:hypothetical protein